MSHLTRGSQLSFVIHVLVIGTIIAVGSSSIIRSRPLVIDFNIEPPAQAPAKKSEPKPLAEKRAMPVLKKVKITLPPPPKPGEMKPGASPSVFAAHAPVETSVPTAKNVTGGLPVVPEGSGFTNQNIASGTARLGSPAAQEQGAVSSIEAAKAAYIKGNFAYIRDIIMKNLSYPNMAREMGWEGKVTVSFIIREDGSVEKVRVVQSSGFEILDKNTLDTIRKAGPFPKPPVKAELIMPVVYRLE
jgi:protein TonB